MRVYGRTYDELGNPTWIEVVTDPQGFNDLVMVTALAQCLKLSLGESPFYANFGIPGQQSVLTQVPPDFYVQRTQQQYSANFASLIISKENRPVPPRERPVPTYRVKIMTHQGLRIDANVPVPI